LRSLEKRFGLMEQHEQLDETEVEALAEQRALVRDLRQAIAAEKADRERRTGEAAARRDREQRQAEKRQAEARKSLPDKAEAMYAARIAFLDKLYEWATRASADLDGLSELADKAALARAELGGVCQEAGEYEPVGAHVSRAALALFDRIRPAAEAPSLDPRTAALLAWASDSAGVALNGGPLPVLPATGICTAGKLAVECASNARKRYQDWIRGGRR